MLQEEVNYTPGAGSSYRFTLVAKRYWLPAFEANVHDPAALTLILLHSTSFHKETWEPTLERLFEHLASQCRVKIREAWAIDCPNHGVAAVHNHALLQQPEYQNKFTCEKYARAAHAFLTSGPVNFRTRNLVGIGHSLGGVAMTFLQCMSKPSIDFSSIILVEPMLSPDGKQHLGELRDKLVNGARTRRDYWKSRAEALQYFEYAMKKKVARPWHPKVVKLFVEHGIRPCKDGFTLACTRDEEVGMYEDNEGSTKPVKCLDRACQRLPIHLMQAEIADYIPKYVQEALTRPSLGRTFTSRRVIPNTGHLIPQEIPEELARHIFDTLIAYPPTPRRSESKL